jgi:site-specific recombinase XerD
MRVPPPPRQHAWTRRSRDYLTPHEVDQLIHAARRTGRYGHRDATMILMTYRHGFRVSELVALTWSHINLQEGTLDVRRRKNGLNNTHPLRGPEIRALRRLRREWPATEYVFLSERNAPLTARTVQQIVFRAGRAAGIPFQVNVHALRHACGYKLANDGQDLRAIASYLGHRNLQSTMRYPEVNARRFGRFWQD